jgi:sugar lactone lactonase YvrE
LLSILLTACSGSGSGTASAPPPPAKAAPTIALLAGDIGALGNLDGPGPQARLNAPGAMAFDAADNLYIADVNNHLIRKLTPQGNLSTVAGNRHSPGSADGAAATSGLANPTGVAVDRAGNVFVLDFGNGTIRKITPAGVVSTLAGTAGQLGNADGAGPAARFGRCTNTEEVDWCPVLPALAIDNSGNLYAADPGNHTVRKITPDGMVSTVAGVAGEAAYIDGPPGVARLHWPAGLAVDASGKIYVTDGNGIRMIAADGSITTIAGAEEANVHAHVDGRGQDARFDTPTAIRVDAAGNLIVGEAGGGWVRKITPGGTVSTIAGTGYGTHPERTLYKVGGLAIDSAGVIFVSDSGNHVIRKLATDGSMPVLVGALSNRWPQDSGIDDAYIPGISGLTVDKTGAAYVLADYALYAQKLLKITQDGAYSAVPYMPNPLDYNYKLAIDNSGIMWLTSNSGVYRMSPDGTVSELDPPPYPENVGNIDGLTVDGDGNAYVSTWRGISKFSPDGRATSVVKFPLGAHAVARDAAGSLYTALDCSNRNGTLYTPDQEDRLTSTNCSIIKVTPTGSMTLVDGNQQPAKFTLPLHMALDQPTGNLYIAENTLSSYTDYKISNETLNIVKPRNQGFLVRKVTPQGEVSTVVGTPDARGFVAGPLPGALPGKLSGIAISGKLLYISSGNAVLVVKDLL